MQKSSQQPTPKMCAILLHTKGCTCLCVFYIVPISRQVMLPSGCFKCDFVSITLADPNIFTCTVLLGEFKGAFGARAEVPNKTVRCLCMEWGGGIKCTVVFSFLFGQLNGAVLVFVCISCDISYECWWSKSP